MTQRVNYAEQSPAPFKKFIEFNTAVKQGAIEESIRDLVAISISFKSVPGSSDAAFSLDRVKLD